MLSTVRYCLILFDCSLTAKLLHGNVLAWWEAGPYCVCYVCKLGKSRYFASFKTAWFASFKTKMFLIKQKVYLKEYSHIAAVSIHCRPESRSFQGFGDFILAERCSIWKHGLVRVAISCHERPLNLLPLVFKFVHFCRNFKVDHSSLPYQLKSLPFLSSSQWRFN